VARYQVKQAAPAAPIANTVNDALRSRGVAVVVKAAHHCMIARGVHKPDTDLVTGRMPDCFRDGPQLRHGTPAKLDN
jgi:GTP cyclohydrolase I